MKRSNQDNFPSLPGVYLFKDAAGKIIYVGKAKSLKSRIRSYFRKPIDSPKTQALIESYRTLEYIVTPSELEALLLESKLIKKFKPRYNVQWRDDKAYPYIKLTINEDWPRLIMARKKEDDGALYFGPYESRSVKETIRLVTRLFLIRTCRETPLRMRGVPCLQYHIKKCWAPCINAVSQRQYLKFVKTAQNLLTGDLSSVLNSLKQEMKQASNEQKFEQAARIRNQIRSIEKMLKRKKGWISQAKGGASLELSKVLGLQAAPKRIEAFDVSNISGSNVVASLVVFEGEEPATRDYRKFIIRGVLGQNDVAAIFDAVYRRFAGSLKEKLDKPDLVLIDGGKPQISAASSAMSKANVSVPVIGLAKREELIYLPGKKLPIKLARDAKALLLLQRARDEAHRFALSFMRKRSRLVRGS